MFDTVLYALATAAAALACVPVVIRFLAGSQVLDIPNRRSSHTTPVVRGGGIGILVPWLAGMVVLWASGALPFAGFPLALGLGVVGMAVIGFVDDVRDLPPLPRLIMEGGLAAACLYVSGLPMHSFAVPGVNIALGWEGWLVAWLFVVGFTNMFNFMDGINGLAGFQTVIGAGGLALLAHGAGDGAAALPMALLAGGALGYLPYNFPNARVFMGDVGSLPLGFALAMAVLRANAGPAGDGGLPLWIPVLTIWPFLLDATYTLVNRTMKGRNPFRAHRSHAYQRLVISGVSHTTVTLSYAAVMLATTAAALVAVARPLAGGALFWIVLGATLVPVAVIMTRVRARDTER